MSITRRFEYTDATSEKFWEVSVAAATVTVHYGRIGTDGQTKVKTYDSPAEATATAEKQISEKVKKGYREVGAGATAQQDAPAPATEEPQEEIEDRDGMQAVVLSGAFRSTIPPKLLTMIEQENDFVHLRGNALFVAYNLDVTSMYGSPFGKTESDFTDFVTQFEASFRKLAPFMKTEFEIYYFTYAGEYTATMWAFRKGTLSTAGGWIGDFCRSRSEEAKNDFVDRNHLPLKSGEIEFELSTAMEKALRKVPK